MCFELGICALICAVIVLYCAIIGLVCGRETLSGNLLHLHAQQPIEHTTGKGQLQKAEGDPFK